MFDLVDIMDGNVSSELDRIEEQGNALLRLIESIYEAVPESRDTIDMSGVLEDITEEE